MAETPFLSEIVMVSFNFAPKGYALCNGQLLPINQNQPLFALLGTTFGGNGQTNFALPDLRDRAPMHEGNGYTLGSKQGAMANTLNMGTMPQHSHPVTATLTLPTGGAPTTTSSDSTFFATAPAGSPGFSPVADEKMATVQAYDMVRDPAGAPLLSTANTTAQTPFNNVMPYLAINFIIALQGIFPSET
ncbi:phage tail protein [Chitinophaga tropicalis]|uniref:Phage tail protein n=1 Tax=Chitinophaga tropicalis TaxID=2683588 RepID=A0A7K1U1H7_9BACT|nr:tail fiber protein [Chitinophaga tropicalis]MVT07875.1 phage tail protein [Chitinophaga tropicalis]